LTRVNSLLNAQSWNSVKLATRKVPIGCRYNGRAKLTIECLKKYLNGKRLYE
jgi:hypothetical protein